jgi:hypothetical protein
MGSPIQTSKITSQNPKKTPNSTMIDLSEDVLYEARELGVYDLVLDIASKTPISAAVTYSCVLEQAFQEVAKSLEKPYGVGDGKVD